MEFSYSDKSLNNLKTCHPELQLLFKEVLKYQDHTILQGHRGKEDQEKAFEEGKTQLHFPYGNHNAWPSNAVDAVPYPIDFAEDPSYTVEKKHLVLARFYWFAGFVFGIAEGLYTKGLMKHKIRWGGDWKGHLDFTDQTFNDLPHFELIPL